MSERPGWDAAPPDVDLRGVWIAVAAQVWRRKPGPFERLAGRLLRSPGLARALVTTPSLLLGWIIATVVVLGAGAAATSGTGVPLVALLAPALAAAGIAYAYGPGIDPAWELTRSMAVSDRMVLLVRALAVFGLNAVLGLAASAVSLSGSGAAAAVTFGWLIPMTAICALALAAATLARSANVGVAAGLGGWAITVAGRRWPSGGLPRSPTPRSSFPTWRSRRAAPRSSCMPPGSREERHERRDRRPDPAVRPEPGRGRGGPGGRSRECSACSARTGPARRRCCA